MISVLVVHYNRPDLLRVCLTSLQAADDVIVVDNGSLSAHEKESLSGEYPEVRWIFLDDNQGFSAGVNHAARAAKGDLFLLLNPDTCWGDDTFEDVEAAYTKSGADIMGLEQVDADGQLQLSTGWNATIGSEAFRKFLQDGLDAKSSWAQKTLARAQGRRKEAYWVAGSALITSRALFESLSGFDEGYFLYFEDMDYCFRARRQGAVVVFSDEFSLMHHRGACASTVQAEARLHYRESQKRFYREHGVGAAKYILPLWGRIRELIKP